MDDLKSIGEEQLKRKETAWDGHHGMRQDKSQKTGRSGDAALKPYAPTSTKKKGEGEVACIASKSEARIYLYNLLRVT